MDPKNSLSPTPALMDYGECATLLRTTIRAIQSMVARRQIPFLKIGRCVRFDSDEIARWLTSRRVVTADDFPTTRRSL